MRFAGLLLPVMAVFGACSLASADADLPAMPIAENAVSSEIVTEPGQSVSITPLERLEWFDLQTFGLTSLGGSLPGAALQTLQNKPHEEGPHWGGFARRYGVSVSSNALSNALEAGVGAAWGEDPRYRRGGAGFSFKSRLGRVFEWTVMAPNKDGDLRPAYARFVAFGGTTLISNEWREQSDTTVGNSLSRVGFSFIGRMGSNAFNEFWPDTKRKLFHHPTHD